MSDDCELLFFDTFSHDSCEELNLDLVQFPRPVYIFEIRVIPLGARVQADFPGGHRLGATNPSSFQLEFFVNDLSKRSASTFERLGSMEYKQNVDIQFPVPNKIPTDGLVLRGWYSAVTLAVYGVLTKVTKERSSPPPPPPPQATGRQPSQEHCPVKDFGSPVTDTQIPEWERQARIPEVPPEPPPPPVRTHQQVVEAPRFVEVPPIIHQPPEPHVTYSTEIPPPVIGGFSEPPPPIVYQECVPVPQVAPAPTPYGQYEPHYSKPWPPPPEEQYQQPTETYDHQMYNRQQDQPMYQPPPDPGHSMWDPNKDRHGPEGHEHEGYGRPALLEHPSMHREKDMSKDRNRDRPWERDMHDYKDDDGRREHEKRKDRDRRSREASWERSSVDSDRYRDRDRDRMRDSVSRDRDRDRDRNRDRGFIDRGVRKDIREGKRPTTPPSPRKMRPHTPQTPPEVEKIISGPRTPKEEPIDIYDERLEGEGEIQEEEITEEDDGYEEIVSEEEDMSDVDDRAMDIIGDIDFDINDETWNFMTSFSPYTCELTTFQHFSDPMLFTYEITQIKNEKIKTKSVLEEKAAEADKIFESLNEVHRQEHTEKWVETLESVNETTLSSLTSLKSQEKFNESIELLIAWTIEGLDFELALKQPQTAYKVRHLKAGIHLTTLLFQTNSDIIQKLLDKDIPKCLLQLYNQPYMVLPVKLLILRGIDAVLSTKAGLDYVVNKTVLFSPPKVFDFNLNWEEVKNEDLTEECITCYQKLLDILSSKQLTRAVVSLSAIMNKIHLYEVLLELSDCVDKLVQSTQLPEPKPAASESPDTPEARASSIDPEIESDIASSSCDSLAQIIIACLQEIMSSYQNAGIQMAQAKRFLPARSQFEFPKSSNPYPSLLRIFRENKLLENIFVILSSPSLSGHPVMLTVLKDLFKEFMISQEGMLFLLSAPDVVNGINRALLHTADETREEATEENITQNLGMHIAYHLQALLYVDCLMACHAKESPKKDIDDADAVSALQNMYTMIFSPVGRPAVIDVLTMSENLNCLLPFVQVTGDEVLDTKKSKSVCAGYVTELLMLVVHYSEDVTMLEKFSDALFNLAQQEITPKLHDLGMWMSPTRSIQSYTHEAVGPLMSVLKSHIENAATLPPELITSLRILQHLTLPKNSNGENEELKYMYAIIQVFTNDGMEGLKGILQNVTDTYLKPSHQSPALVGLQGVLIVAVIKPAVFILKSILAYLISSRGTEFKDLTTVPVLLKVYSLMILVPPSSFSYQMAQAVQSEIIEALLTYTQPFLGTAESEEALSKSLWTEMVQEILKYVKLSPSTFVTGLTVLSELLPLPLPLQTRDPLCEDEITKMINYRKLWSAHLHSLSSTIQEVIVSLAATSCHPLQQLLRRVCVQLADLAAPTALFIVKAVLDALLEALMLPPPEQKENLDPSVPPIHDFTPVLKTPTSSTARILNLVSYLVSHASFKIPMIHVMRGSVKSDEKYLDVLPLMLELFNTPSDKPYVIQSHECIVSILQSLCDPDIGFITFESGASVNDVLSSSLPCKEQISQICGALVQHIGCHQHSYSSVLPSLRSLVMLTEHDYGYYHVKHGLDQHPGAVFSLFTRFSLSFSKDSSDCLSTLSTTLEFLRLMVNGYDDGGTTGRSILLPTSELAELLREDPAKGDKDKNKSSEPFQPVVELAKLLTEFGNDEEAVESLLESISGLLSLLNSAPTKTVKLEKEIVEPTLASPESQSAQFASRPVFMVGEVEEGRLSPAYWLSLLGADDTDQEQEQVPVDLIAIAEKNISGEFDLKSTLENLCLSADGEMDLNSKNKNITCIGGKRKYQPLINPALVDVNNKRPFIAPMRGRGFTRGNSHSSRANDPFRSRPPNTSRPPSMHVDDFVALESHHGGSSQPQNKRPVKEGGGRGRGRGGFERSSAFTSTRGTGGRFFSPPGPYGRRESNRGNRGTSRLSNNAWNNRSNPNSGQKLSPGPGQRTGFGGHRCDYNSPFNPSDTRPSGQRNRDSYTDLGRPSNVISLNRFPRGLRAGGMNQGNQGHWQDRGKGQNQRFITPGAPSRGSGRRDMNARHNRSFTR